VITPKGTVWRDVLEAGLGVLDDTSRPLVPVVTLGIGRFPQATLSAMRAAVTTMAWEDPTKGWSVRRYQAPDCVEAVSRGVPLSRAWEIETLELLIKLISLEFYVVGETLPELELKLSKPMVAWRRHAVWLQHSQRRVLEAVVEGLRSALDCLSDPDTPANKQDGACQEAIAEIGAAESNPCGAGLSGKAVLRLYEEHGRIWDLIKRRDDNVAALRKLRSVCMGEPGPAPSTAEHMNLCKSFADGLLASKEALSGLRMAVMTRSEATEAEDEEPLHDDRMTNLIRLMSSGDEVALLQFQDHEYWREIANGTLHLTGPGERWHRGRAGRAEVGEAEVDGAKEKLAKRGFFTLGKVRWEPELPLRPYIVMTFTQLDSLSLLGRVGAGTSLHRDCGDDPPPQGKRVAERLRSPLR